MEPWRDRLVFDKRALPQIVQRVVCNAWTRVDDETDRIGDIGVYLSHDGPVLKIPDRVPEMMFDMVRSPRVSQDCGHHVKRAVYHRFGVREYVIIDRFKKVVTVLTREPGGYAERILSVGQTYESPLFPGLAIPLSEVF